MNALSLSDVEETGKIISITIRYSKTDQLGKGCTIKIPQSAGSICPVHNLQNYVSARPKTHDSLFCHFDGAPLTKYQFSAVMKKALKLLGYDLNRYKLHSV